MCIQIMMMIIIIIIIESLLSILSQMSARAH